jgi:hypothetical protein
MSCPLIRRLVELAALTEHSIPAAAICPQCVATVAAAGQPAGEPLRSVCRRGKVEWRRPSQEGLAIRMEEIIPEIMGPPCRRFAPARPFALESLGLFVEPT